jgi:UDP-3-O-[3-hydroxymyristoyl] N-acetylglucosamine deacetylase
MTSPHRATVASAFRIDGVGVHSGMPCAISVEPAESGGIVFAGPRGECPATVEFAIAQESRRRTVIANGAARFEQIEHVMAALAAFAITDARIAQEGPEPPFCGGGSREFCAAIRRAGIRALAARVEPLVVTRPVSFEGNGAAIMAAPGDGLRLTAGIEFEGTFLRGQSATFAVTPETFEAEIAPARTFVLEREIEQLRAMGLGKGADEGNTLVLGAESYRNPALFPDEPSRHKVLDLLGDLALVGRPIVGHVMAWRAGHESHLHFARHLLSEFAH